MKKLILCLSVLLLGLQVQAQVPNFTVIDTLEEGAYGAAAWGDLDNDGDMDLCYISQIMPDAATEVYINNNNVFTRTQQGFPLLYNPAVVWADFNNDGFDDLVMNGMDSLLAARTFIYKSNGNGTFTAMPNTIPGLASGSVDVTDYNNDNLIDIAVTGMDDLGQTHTYVYKNTSNFVFISNTTIDNGVYFGELQWGDYNHDNLADFVISGRNFDCGTYVYKNMGADSFLLQPIFLKGSSGTVDWFDYNEDSWLDILVMGMDSTFGNNFVRIYNNNQNGTFTPAATNLIAFGEPNKLDIADIDNDGHNDVLCMGGNDTFFNGSGFSFGNGTAQFNNVNFAINASIENPNVEAADIDNDGDIDLLWGFYILRNDNPLGIGEAVNDNSISIYPQPATNSLNLKSAKEIKAITIYDMNGSKVFYSTVNSTQTNITIDLANGMYIAELSIDNGLVRKKLVVTQH